MKYAQKPCTNGFVFNMIKINYKVINLCKWTFYNSNASLKANHNHIKIILFELINKMQILVLNFTHCNTVNIILHS